MEGDGNRVTIGKVGSVELFPLFFFFFLPESENESDVTFRGFGNDSICKGREREFKIGARRV